MDVAPGVHPCTVAGKARRLRISLDAIREIESQTRQPFIRTALQLTDQFDLRWGDAFLLFVEFCAAGGTPLTREERDALRIPDLLQAIIPALIDALIGEGVLERLGSAPEDPAKKKAT